MSWPEARKELTMSDDKVVVRNGGVGCFGFVALLTVLFVGLKLTNNIDWAWIWVLSPLWIYIGLVIIAIVAVVIVLVVSYVLMD